MNLDLRNASTILVAPLNWGLGHATRSMVIIDFLLSQNKKIIIASDGLAAKLLSKEYPNLIHESLPPLEIDYKGKSFLFSMLRQASKISHAIKKENAVTNSLVAKHKIDLIISDNRYGVHHSNIHSILLTHQLTPYFKTSILKFSAFKIIKNFSRGFHEFWVPDYEDRRLSGMLSDDKDYENVKYIGPLSRFSFSEKEIKTKILAIVSGPEPKRTNFEKAIIALMNRTPGKHHIIRGTLKENNDHHPSIEFTDLADKNMIQDKIEQTEIIICRSGYSSIMDYIESKKKIIWVPTPGQTEQEYLAEHLRLNMGYTTINENQLPKLELD